MATLLFFRLTTMTKATAAIRAAPTTDITVAMMMTEALVPPVLVPPEDGGKEGGEVTPGLTCSSVDVEVETPPPPTTALMAPPGGRGGVGGKGGRGLAEEAEKSLCTVIPVTP